MKVTVFKRTAAYLLALALALTVLTIAVGGSETLDFDRKGEIQITLKDRHGIVTGGAFTLWQVGRITLEEGVYRYAVTEAFAGSHLTLKELTDPELPGKFRAWAERQDLPGRTAEVDREGSAAFEELDLGVYLVVQTRRSPGYYAAPAFLVTVPFETRDGLVYRVDASPKLELEPRPGRPQPRPPREPDADLSEPETPLSPPDLPEPQDPSGVPEAVLPEPEVPLAPHIPQTGQLNWPVPVMAAGGLVLFALGWLVYHGKGERDEN